MPDPTPIHVMHVMEATAGGSRKQLRYLVQGLRQAGVAVDLILSSREADPDFTEDLRAYGDWGCWVKSVHMQKQPGPQDVPLVRRLAAIIRERRPQIVHSHCAKGGLVGRLAARRADPTIRTVHTPHSYFFQNLEGVSMNLGIRLERWLGRRTDLLLCIAEAERNVALSHDLIAADRIVIAANGLPADFASMLRDRATVRSELGLEDDVVAVGIMSRLVPRKGLRVLPEAVAAIPDVQRRRLRLCLYGDGPLRRELETRVRELNLRRQIQFLGYRPHAERDWLGFDLGLLMSRYEGLSYQLLETLAAGRPLIATDVPGNRLSTAGNPIRYVPRDDPTALADALATLITDPDLRQSLGARSAAWVATHYALQRQIDTTISAYRGLLG